MLNFTVGPVMCSAEVCAVESAPSVESRFPISERPSFLPSCWKTSN